MKKLHDCREAESPWTKRLLQSVPIALSLFVAIGSTAEMMVAGVSDCPYLSRFLFLKEVW